MSSSLCRSFNLEFNSVLHSVTLPMKWKSRNKITLSFTKIFQHLPARSPFSRSYFWPCSTKMRKWLSVEEDLGPGNRRRAKRMASHGKGRPGDTAVGAVTWGSQEDCPQVNPECREELRGWACATPYRKKKSMMVQGEKNVIVASSSVQQQTINNKYFHNENAVNRDISRWNLSYSKRKLADNI